jgi:hypothetical protein
MAKNTESLLKELEFRMVVTTAILSTLDLDYVLYVILSGITSRDGLGFNRAFLLLDDEEGRTLKVRLAVGPRTGEDAQRIWTEIEREEGQLPGPAAALRSLPPGHGQSGVDPRDGEFQRAAQSPRGAGGDGLPGPMGRARRRVKRRSSACWLAACSTARRGAVTR